MSEAEALTTDTEAVVAAAQALNPGLTTTADLVRFLQDNLMPLIASHVESHTELDEAVMDLVEQTEDILQPETAKDFGMLIVMGQAIVQKCIQLAPKDPKGKLLDGKLAQALAAYMVVSKRCQETLEEITLAEGEDEDEDMVEGEGPDVADADDAAAEDEAEDDDTTEGSTP